MAPKPKIAVHKDPVTAGLALRAHFLIADEYLKDTTLAQLGKKMFLQVQNPTGVPFFTGEYYQASKRIADENQEELKHNGTSFDLLLRYQASSYCSGEKLRRWAQDIEQELLNELHSLFCQEVNIQWLDIPGRQCERRPRMYAPSFVAMPASISALVISPPSFTQVHDVRTLMIARARLTVKQTSQTIVCALFASH